MNTEQAKEWGVFAEQLARDHLLAEGYSIREQNWRPKGAKYEVDIIAEIAGEIVFVEVKARDADGEDPADAVDDKKIKNLCRAANYYLSSQDYDFEFRFDIITVSGNKQSYSLDHIPDAFLPPLNFI